MEKELILDQPDRGYRFSEDSLLLAEFFDGNNVNSLLDIGAGVGSISIPIAKRYPNSKVVAVEIDPEMAGYAKDNAVSSGVDSNYDVIVGDIMSLEQICPKPLKFDAIVCNPPYYKMGAARVSPDMKKAAARHEVHMTLAGLIEKASALLIAGGTLNVLTLHERRSEYLSLLDEFNFVETRREGISKNSSPRLFISEATLNNE